MGYRWDPTADENYRRVSGINVEKFFCFRGDLAHNISEELEYEFTVAFFRKG